MSKELNALKEIGNYRISEIDYCVKDTNEYEIIEKSLKVLEIIKEKGNFINLEYADYEDKYYIYDNELYMHNEITKEEYDLLKEVLK